ncbi:cyclin [Thecamonas trahens ATCC 50062]|uniref:Cyclin n=1 Tax=Thecamonas trahens ATCC 50062 TaxID=461836 RepID=A0A0L0DBG6_THETB|nr:cyclin [Thecamonas trahens ATCC 50062]KNC49456.1 cyclin [Thecamonas trahens ATCC 50062]|eukprot:XP_013757876.1 cyclin [Thecamonas trahens ATCC 50062]
MEASSWYVTLDELKKHTPSREDGMDYATECAERQKQCMAILHLGAKLNVPTLAKATAVLFFHRFFLRRSFKKHDAWLVAVTCLFLATKVEESSKKLRNVVDMAFEQRYPGEARDDSKLFQLKEQILIHERKVLQTLAFDLTVVHPYKDLMPMASDIHASRELAQSAWSFINDSLSMTLCLRYQPREVAAAAIYLSALHQKVNLDEKLEGKSWIDIVGVPLKTLEMISNEILDMYARHGGTVVAQGSAGASSSTSTASRPQPARSQPPQRQQTAGAHGAQKHSSRTARPAPY